VKPWEMGRFTWRELSMIDDYFRREQEAVEAAPAFDPAVLPFTEEA
jgi:hypothetical protein